MSDETESQEDVSELRKAAEGGKAAKREAELAKRELAFVKAGVDTDKKPARALLENYDGELTSDAIRAEATEWGLLEAAESTEASPAESAAEAVAEAQATRESLEGRPAPDEPAQIGGVDAALKNFLKNKEDGMSQVNATNHAFGEVIKAAAQGDKQARFSEDDWEEERAKYGHGAEFAK